MTTSTGSSAKATSADIVAAIERRYPSPEFYGEAEVELEGRRLDYVVFELRGGRGVSGFEIKVSRHDWQRELTNFRKTEQWASICDRFYLVVAKGVLESIHEVPIGWGVLELRGTKLFTLRQPAAREAGSTLPREVVARFFARLVRAEDARFRRQEAALRAEIAADNAKMIEARVARIVAEDRDGAEKWRRIEKDAALYCLDIEKVGERMKRLANLEVVERRVARAVEQIRHLKDAVDGLHDTATSWEKA